VVLKDAQQIYWWWLRLKHLVVLSLPYFVVLVRARAHYC
jgi:hypothetical protein